MYIYFECLRHQLDQLDNLVPKKITGHKRTPRATGTWKERCENSLFEFIQRSFKDISTSEGGII